MLTRLTVRTNEDSKEFAFQLVPTSDLERTWYFAANSEGIQYRSQR